MATNKPTQADEWDTIDEGSRIQVSFDTLKDEFIGVLTGWDTVTDPNTGKTWDVAEFTGVSVNGDTTEVGGQPCQIAPGYDLKRALQKIDPHASIITRIVFDRVQDVGQASPMKVFKVQVKR